MLEPVALTVAVLGVFHRLAVASVEQVRQAMPGLLVHLLQLPKPVLATEVEVARLIQAARVAQVVQAASREEVAVVAALEQPPEVLAATVATVTSLS